MRGKVWMNGTIFAPDDAKISIFDRGFLYGDSVFETLRVYRRVPFEQAAHLQRLRASGARIGFDLPWGEREVADAIRSTIGAGAIDEAYLRVIATRGGGPMGLDPSLAADPQLIVMVLPLPALPEEMYSQGRSAALVSVQRNAKRTVDPQAKTGNYLLSVLATAEAGQLGAQEAIMLAPDGRVAEASAANVFALVDGVWRTPPLEVGILSGITRKTVLNLCAEAGLPAEESELWPQDLIAATEIFLCASVREIVPIVRLDDEKVGDGMVGPSTAEVRRLFRLAVERAVDDARASGASPRNC